MSNRLVAGYTAAAPMPDVVAVSGNWTATSLADGPAGPERLYPGHHGNQPRATLGVKFGNGGQGVRITTVIYGALGTIVGLVFLFVGLDVGIASAVIFPLMWVVFGAIITAAPVVSSSTAWFSRPRY